VHPPGADSNGIANLISETQVRLAGVQNSVVQRAALSGTVLDRIRRLDDALPAGRLDSPRLTSFLVPAGLTRSGTDG
jgi:hypothetical protein